MHVPLTVGTERVGVLSFTVKTAQRPSASLSVFFCAEAALALDAAMRLSRAQSEAITDPRPFETPWSKSAQLRTTEVEAMQRTLTKLGIYKDKIDGKAGMLTRSALGAYQKANGLNTDCWPTAALLTHMQAAGP